jgi:hypothetical protein
MAVTQADIDNLNAAIAAGVRSATVGGQTITYGTIDALIKARDDLIKQIAAQDPNRAIRPRQTYSVYAGRGHH